ncbi:hypothetical protein AB0M46_44915, partial [Dactylosporangium sp. NPDC051485]
MYRRLWFDLPATVLHAEHALSRSTGADPATDPTLSSRTRTDTHQPALILRSGPSPLLAGNGIPQLHATPAVAAAHTDPLGAGNDTGNDAGAVRARTHRLPLAVRSPLLGIPL